VTHTKERPWKDVERMEVTPGVAASPTSIGMV
jgi:hypothetical protein